MSADAPGGRSAGGPHRRVCSQGVYRAQRRRQPVGLI